MAVSIIINQNPALTVPWSPNLTIHKALEGLYNQTQDHKVFSFAIDFYGTYEATPFGYMVVMVNNVYDLPSQNMYWAVQLNGQYITRGVDYASLNDGDTVSLINTPYVQNQHAGTHLELKRKGASA